MRLGGRSGVGRQSLYASLLGIFAGLGLATSATAADCPGHPDAIGTSRVLVVDPREHPRIGAMQYKETLPLHDHEIVLTFDDGPVPKYSNQVLQILADQCAKATFFTIGQQAKSSPEGVRKLAAAGQTIGTHSWDHPLTFNKMAMDKAKPEVDQGIAAVTAALTDPSVLAPFFRVPGLLHGEAVETYAASLGIQVWSADFLADDWRNISAARVYDLAIKRIEARRRGILLLHDIHARTVAALPKILNELKARGYHIVQVVPATSDRPVTPTEPGEWLVHRPSDGAAVAEWPRIPSFNFARATTLPGPTSADFAMLNSPQLMAGGAFDQEPPAPGAVRETPWPRVVNLRPFETASVLPVPAPYLFEKPDFVVVATRTDPHPVRHAKHEERPARAAKTTKREANAETTERRNGGVGSMKKRS